MRIACVREGDSPYSEGDRHPREHCEGDGDCKDLLRPTHGGSGNGKSDVGGIGCEDRLEDFDPRRKPEGRMLSRRGAQEG